MVAEEVVLNKDSVSAVLHSGKKNKHLLHRMVVRSIDALLLLNALIVLGDVFSVQALTVLQTH